MKYSLSNLSLFKKNVHKKNGYFVMVALIIITIISVGFGIVFSKGEDIRDRKVEGFGEFSSEVLDSDMNVTYTFNYDSVDGKADVDKPTPINGNVSAEKILKVANAERPYYQVRFPKNAYSFKPLKIEFECEISSIEVNSKSGTITCEIWEHDVYDEKNNFEYKKRNEKGTRMTNKVERKSKLLEKRIFSNEYYPPDGKSIESTNKTTLKNNTYQITIDSGLPNEIIPNRHTIWIGGNSSISYESINMTIVGNVEGVQQIYSLSSVKLTALTATRFLAKDNGVVKRFQITRPPQIPNSIYVDKIVYENRMNSWGDDKGYCLSVRHNIQFLMSTHNIFDTNFSENRDYKLGSFEKYMTHENRSHRYDSDECNDVVLTTTHTIQVNKKVDVFNYLNISVTFNNNGGNNHKHHFYSNMMDIYYRIKREAPQITF